MSNIEKRGGSRLNAGRKSDLRKQTARESIRLFLDNQLPRMDQLFDQVVNGVPKLDAEGQPIRDVQGSIVHVVKPNPEGGIKLLADLAEFVTPRLSRSDINQVVQVEQQQDVRQMTTAELQNLVLQQLGILSTGEPQEVIDVTPLPDLQEAPTRDD